MSDNRVELIQKVQDDLKGDFTAFREAQQAADKLRDEIASKFDKAVSSLEPFPEDMDEDEMDDQLDELRDAIGNVAYKLGLTWDDYGWSPGEAVEMWEASTC